MTDPKALAVAYYTALGRKDIEAVSTLFHPDIQFKAPFGEKTGNKAVLEAAREFTTYFNTLKIRAEFGTESQAMIVYEIDLPAMNRTLQAAALLHVQEGLISKIELIYDTGCFVR